MRRTTLIIVAVAACLAAVLILWPSSPPSQPQPLLASPPQTSPAVKGQRHFTGPTRLREDQVIILEKPSKFIDPTTGYDGQRGGKMMVLWDTVATPPATSQSSSLQH